MKIIKGLFQKIVMGAKNKGGEITPLKDEFQVTLNRLQKEYKEAYDAIEVEINRWRKDMDKIKSTNPKIRFSELKQLEDLAKQVDLILAELSQLDPKVVGNDLDDLYVSDYMDIVSMLENYKKISNNYFQQFNQLASVQTLEAYINTTHDYKESDDVMKIKERAEELGYSIESKLKQAIIRGDGYNKVAGQLANDLGVSFENAKSLIQMELKMAEITTKIHQAKQNGYTHMQRRSMRDKHVCEICRSLDGTIYQLDSITAKDVVLHPNDRCTLVEVVVDENGKVKHSQYYDEAQGFIKQRAIENAERAQKIREEYYKNRRAKQENK